jgi:hypothetical protein
MLFGAFAEIYARLEWPDFAKMFPIPLLQIDVGELVATSEDRMLQYAATSTAPAQDSTLFPMDEGKGWRNSLVAPMVKSERNDFPGKIMLGRSEVNDVVVPNRSVSKLHAYFQQDAATGLFSIVDARSTCGTTVNELPIPPGESTPLESGAQLLFGQAVPALFFSSRDFFNYMRLKLRKGKTRKRS